MAVELDLLPPHQKIVRDILAGVVPDAKVWVFGSRATGHARPFSDLDLLLTDAPKLNWQQRAALRDALEQSDLPFCVDCVEESQLPAGMWQRVFAERILLSPGVTKHEPT